MLNLLKSHENIYVISYIIKIMLSGIVMIKIVDILKM